MKTINLTVNGRAVSASVEPRTQLADFLRETLNLTGTHLGCEHGVCGACTLYIDGAPARSCITLAVACDGASITTIEGFDDDEIMRALREAFSREHALQCGYCTPGMLASARDIVMRQPEASEHEIRVAMSGNLCRCTGYVGIVRAIQSVIAERKTKCLHSPVPATTLGPADSGTFSAREKGASSFPLPSGEGSRVREGSGVGTENEGRFAEGAARPGKPQTTLQQAFSVDHPRTRVWDLFGRLGEVTTCLPGTSLIAAPTADRVEPRIRIKLGPIVAEFEGVAEIVRDPANYAGTIHGSARDTRSNSRTRGEIRYTLHEERGGAATRVDLEVGYTLTGALAQFSRSSLVQDIAKRMTAAFAANLQARLDQGDKAASIEDAGQATAPALDAGSLIFSVLWNRVKAFFRGLSGR